MVCPVCGFDPSHVTPADGAVALRSYRRRFRAALALLEEEPVEDPRVVSPPSGGPSAADHARQAAAAFEQAAEDLRIIAIQEDPILRPVAGPVEARSPDAILDWLDLAADRAASQAESIRGTDWERTGRRADGGSVRALDVLREAVHDGIHHLRAAEHAMQEVRAAAT